MTDLKHDPGLVWGIEASLAGAPQTWHYGFYQHSVSLEETCCLQISLSCEYPRFAVEIDSILSHYYWTLTQLGMVATHDGVTKLLRFRQIITRLGDFDGLSKSQEELLVADQRLVRSISRILGNKGNIVKKAHENTCSSGCSIAQNPANRA
jgi:hypothetical protein